MDTQPKKPGHRFNKNNTNTTKTHPAETTVSADEHQRTVTELQRERGKRRSRPLLAVLLSLLLIGLGAAVALYLYTQYGPGSGTAEEQQTPAAEQPADEPDMTARRAIEALPDSFSASDDEFTMQPIKVAGYDHFTLAHASSAAASIIDSGESTVVLASVGKDLRDLGFTETIEQNDTENDIYFASYTHADAICRVMGEGTINNPAGKYSVTVGCADTDDVTAVAEAQKPYAELTPDQTNSNSTLGFVGMPQPKASQTDGYQTVELHGGGIVDGRAGAGGAMYLFYQTPDNTWHFFTGTQNVLPCERYNTDDLRNAYDGEPCGEGQRVSTP